MIKLILGVLLSTGLNAEMPLDIRKECQKGNTIECYNLALMYQRGEGVNRSSATASRFFRVVCDKGGPKNLSIQACYQLGFIYYIGLENGIKQNYRYSIQKFSKACDGGYPKSCHQLGIMYRNGEGVRQNNSTAKEYFRKACDLGNNDGCKDYAEMNI